MCQHNQIFSQRCLRSSFFLFEFQYTQCGPNPIFQWSINNGPKEDFRKKINKFVGVVYTKLLQWFSSVLRIRIRIRSDPGFLGHPDPDPDPGKKFKDSDPDPDPDPSSTIIFKSQNNGIWCESSLSTFFTVSKYNFQITNYSLV